MTITQADRDAAAAFNKFPTWEGSQRVQDRAARDTAQLAEAFAAHRLTERARIVAWLREEWERGGLVSGDELADAIEAGEHVSP